MGNKNGISADPKSKLKTASKSPENKQLSREMALTLGDYALSLHGITEDSKDTYIGLVKWFGLWLIQRNIRRFEVVTSKDIDLFLSKYNNDSTNNNYIIRLKHFYGKFLKHPELVARALKISDSAL